MMIETPKRLPLFPALLALTLLVTACGRDDTNGDIASDSAHVDPAGTPAPSDSSRAGALGDTSTGAQRRPGSRVDTILVEGDPQAITSLLVETDRYTTYYSRDDMIVEQSTSGEGTGVRFIANFAGTRNDSAFVHIFTPADGTAGADEARRLLFESSGIVASQGWTASKSSGGRCPGASESYLIKGPRSSSMTGFACVGEHAGTGWVIVSVYPYEYAEGMGPRVEQIMRELRWNDNGAGLE